MTANKDDDFERLGLTESQIEEINRRVAEMDANPSLGITQEELWRRVDEMRCANRVDDNKAKPTSSK